MTIEFWRWAAVGSDPSTVVKRPRRVRVDPGLLLTARPAVTRAARRKADGDIDLGDAGR